ncbi:amphi-Trp domain-containing protein [Alteromonadaceae bacterium Bs31]|nr:amphi-Trp domain-containing protein [Alteromonadaceae bacterium Bs31]
MQQNKNLFTHESLQDAQSIQDILKAVTKGLAKGKLNFSDEDGEVVLKPEGLLNLKVTARRENANNRLDLRISWRDEEKLIEKKNLRVE